MSLVISMGEVETGDTHTSIDHCFKLRNLPTGRSEGANDLGTAYTGAVGLSDGIQGNTRATKGRTAGGLGLHAC